MTHGCLQVAKSAATGNSMGKQLRKTKWLTTDYIPCYDKLGDHRVAQTLNDARLSVDETVARAPRNVMHVFHDGVDNKRWLSGDGPIDPGPLWNDMFILIRSDMNRRIDQYRAAGGAPKIIVLDGIVLYTELLKHPPHDKFLSCEKDDSYTNDSG
eukprot:6864007-Pyramimonas_sp.AAC.2